MVEFLEKHGIVTNYDAIVKYMSDRAGRFISEIDLQEILERGAAVYYFEHEAKTSYEICSGETPRAVLKIIETSVIDVHNNNPLCLSYRKLADGNWEGCFVGTRQFLFNKQLAQYAAPDKQSKGKASDAEPTFLQQIYSVLYYKENWEHNGRLFRLATYISTLRKKIENDWSKGKMDNVLVNNTGMKFIFNSRLLDCFGNYIHIMAEKGNQRYTYVASRQFLRENGFDMTVLNVPPVEFFKNISDVVFKAELEDIDLSDVAALHHIINERRFRFPEAVRDKSDMEIMNCLRVSIDHSVKMSKIDYKFVVPMYSIEYDKIQYLMPVYFDFGKTQKAELALVLNNTDGIWQVRTILPLENALCNARLLCSPTNSWLTGTE